MTKLLRIDASSRIKHSHSRQMADYFQKKWLANNPNDEIILRDIIKNPLPHLTDETIAGFYSEQPAMKAATALSDQLVKELMLADVLLISTPMYNFSVPSALKAWIDHIVRIGYTFNFDPDKGYEGLVTGKKAYIITACGAVFSDEAMIPLNFLEPYLKTLLGFLGISEVEFFPLEGTDSDEAAFERSKKAAMEKIDKLLLEDN
ncbi:hypothetical protein PN36_08145 [Candidatus Thiomargarita nelsonii]|uniref:FMN dependent NADH:quinone oxidoreductase n=1 Tax=Candidatus Thiomargarita nelsonii TaxID=1003181 RepID=A0A0A6PB75_9GAMM|nr:hypothetical protein PN36_08145 [Candidatus Thiomargarita nelsonii]